MQKKYRSLLSLLANQHNLRGVVGSDIEIINSKTLAESSYSNQLGDVITDNISGENFHLDSTIQMQAL
jgi:hypothetical protein